MCQSPMPLAEYRALQERIKAEYPKTCRACGAPGPIPTFLARNEWQCDACSWTWFPESLPDKEVW